MYNRYLYFYRQKHQDQAFDPQFEAGGERRDPQRPQEPQQAPECKTSVAFVEGGVPQYNSKGCITGYQVGLILLI